jgi:hypothetical protein
VCHTLSIGETLSLYLNQSVSVAAVSFIIAGTGASGSVRSHVDTALVEVDLNICGSVQVSSQDDYNAPENSMRLVVTCSGRSTMTPSQGDVLFGSLIRVSLAS